MTQTLVMDMSFVELALHPSCCSCGGARMDMTSLNELEGRMIAQRRVLLQIANSLGRGDAEALLAWLEDQVVMPDGQEDPGAVPAEGVALEMAMTQELRLFHLSLTEKLAHGGR